jgi:UDP-N-acetyl-D-glucosamine dehydrogenase
MREHHFDLSSVEVYPKTLSEYDCVIIATDHDHFDYELLQKYAVLIVDTRGVYSRPAPNIIKA